MNSPIEKSISLPSLENYSPEEISRALDSFPLGWFIGNRMRTSSGSLFEFNKRKFLRSIVGDMHPLQVILKPPQVGLSETLFVKLCYVASKLGKNVIYTLPSQSDVEDMVGGKFNPLIVQNDVLRKLVRDHDTVYQKKIGANMLYLRGTVGKTQAMMVSSGLNVHDELDSSDMATVIQYETRQEAQEKKEDKWRWYLSHPSFAGTGVDLYWNMSDKKEWAIRCPSCSQMQFLSWPASISEEREAYICTACGGVLDDEARVKGAWAPTSQGPFSGYHISQMMLYNKSAKDILAAFHDPLKDRRYFYNYVLGLPYTGGDDKITVEQVLSNCTEKANSQSGRIMIGVDPGLPVHFLCMNAEGVFFYGTCKPPSDTDDGYEDIRRLLRMWPKAVVVCDQGGEMNPSLKMQQDFPGRIFRAIYRKDRKSNRLIEWGQGHDWGTVRIDRNSVIQSVFEQLKEGGRIPLCGTRAEWALFAEHAANMYRERITSENRPGHDDRALYGAEYVWKRRGPDHFAHCLVYAIAGMDKFGSAPAEVQGAGLFDSAKTALLDTEFTGDVILRGTDDGSIAF